MAIHHLHEIKHDKILFKASFPIFTQVLLQVEENTKTDVKLNFFKAEENQQCQIQMPSRFI